MGEPDAELLRENQESIGKLTRAAHDITSEQAVGQEFIDETLFPSIAVRQQYEKGNYSLLPCWYESSTYIQKDSRPSTAKCVQYDSMATN